MHNSFEKKLVNALLWIAIIWEAITIIALAGQIGFLTKNINTYLAVDSFEEYLLPIMELLCHATYSFVLLILLKTNRRILSGKDISKANSENLRKIYVLFFIETVLLLFTIAIKLHVIRKMDVSAIWFLYADVLLLFISLMMGLLGMVMHYVYEKIVQIKNENEGIV